MAQDNNFLFHSGFSGVYKITNTMTGMVYFGSAKCLKRRKYTHFWELKLNKHGNKHLQRSYNKYGHQAFIFEVVEFTPVENLIKIEQVYLDKHWDNHKTCYNDCKTASTWLGMKHSAATKKILSQKVTGRKHSLKTKEKISTAGIGRVKSLSTREKLSLANKGKSKSLETKQKMSLAKKGKMPHPNSLSSLIAGGRVMAASRRKSVVAKNINTNEELVFESVTKASEHTKVNTGRIAAVCNKKINVAKGWVFSYKEKCE